MHFAENMDGSSEDGSDDLENSHVDTHTDQGTKCIHGDNAYTPNECTEAYHNQSYTLTTLQNHQDQDISQYVELGNLVIIEDEPTLDHKDQNMPQNDTSENLEIMEIEPTQKSQCTQTYMTRIAQVVIEHEKHECPQPACKYQGTSEAGVKIHHNKVHGHLKFHCSECEFVGDSRKGLNIHKVREHSNNRFKCDFCYFTTITRSAMNVHIKSQHKKENIQCIYCKHTAKTNVNMDRHVKREHTQKQIYSCQICDFKTKYESSVERHYFQRHGTETLKCKYCDFTTRIKNKLYRHYNEKHGGYHACGQCDFRTTIRSYLRKHLVENHYNIVESVTV